MAFPQTPFEFSTEGEFVVVSTKKLIYMKDWYYKGVVGESSNSVGGNKLIDILIDAFEVIGFDSSKIPVIKLSTVKVNYFSKNERAKTLLPLESIRYDHAGEWDSRHPYFHAHVSDEVICNNSNKPEQLRGYTILDSNMGRRYECVRIPTPQMNLVSVLLSLAADNTRPRILKNLIKIPAVTDFPKTSMLKIFESIKGDECSFRSKHWYPENY